MAKSNEFVQNRSYLICFGYSKAHEDLQVPMRYLFLVRCLTAYQKRLEFPLWQGGYDDVFIDNLIIIYNQLHFVDIVEVRGSSSPNPTIAKPPDCRVAFLLRFSRRYGALLRQGEDLDRESTAYAPFGGHRPNYLERLRTSQYHLSRYIVTLQCFFYHV